MDLWIDDEKTGKERFIIDGFNLTELNIVERQIFKENYIDENSLSNFYLARKKVNELKHSIKEELREHGISHTTIELEDKEVKNVYLQKYLHLLCPSLAHRLQVLSTPSVIHFL